MIRRVAIVFFVAILSACVNDSQPFKEFEPLRTESDAQNLYQLVSSEDFSGRTWEQVEQQVMNWAQRKIGSFEGKASTTQKIGSSGNRVGEFRAF